MKDYKEKTPVFVFLDENVSCTRFEKLKRGCISPKYELKIVPFPLDMDGLGIFDFQVVLYLKKRITSRFYGIRQILYRSPKPLFVFLTGDLTFIDDARKGFESWKGNKKRKHQNKDVKLYKDPLNSSNDTIVINLDDDYRVDISVRYVKGGKNDNQQIILNKMIKLLEEFLS